MVGITGPVPERRKKDRVRGDLITIKRLVMVSLFASLISLGAFGFAIVGVVQIYDQRTSSRLESCYLLRGLVFAATKSAPKSRAASNAYINATPLRNCNEYSRTLK